MGYTVSIISRSEREARISKSLLSPIGDFDFYEFRSKHSKLQKIRISIDVPVYRMENFRTFTDQAEYLTKEKKPSNFFAAGQEVESVQQVQHDMLARLARRGIAGSIVPVIDVLEREKQREPLLITRSGVVVNGNRRLAAMRELFFDEPGQNSELSHADCAVLPADATAGEIVDIEAGLQAKQETKLAYDWIGDAQLMSRMVELHKDASDVARRLDRGEKEIRNSIQALAEADLYLKEWARAEGEYSRVREEAEQLFKDLPRRLEGKDAALQAASRAIAWTLFDNRDRLPGRVYDFNAAFGKLASDVMERISTELGVSTEVVDKKESGDDFAVDFDSDDTATSYEAVIELLKDPEIKDEAVDALIEASQNAIEAEKGQKSGEAALKAVGQAHAKLMAVDISRAVPGTHAAMRKQLEGIEQLARLLIKKIDTYGQEQQ